MACVALRDGEDDGRGAVLGVLLLLLLLLWNVMV